MKRTKIFKLEPELRSALNELRESPVGNDKQSIRVIMAGQKLDYLLRNRRSLKRIEPTILNLLYRVDYSRIAPRLRLISPNQRSIWTYCRNIISSAPYRGRPGRSLFFLAVDERTGGILGVLDIGSDVFCMPPRDKYIGWTRDVQFRQGRRMNFIAVMGTCIATTPFGLLTGGKYVAVAATGEDVLAKWFKRYNEPLAALTTTSLYGKSSQYNRLKEWRYLGLTSGRGFFHIPEKTFALMKRFVVANHLIGRHSTSLSMPGKWEYLNLCLGRLSIKEDEISSNQPRGVYIASLSVDPDEAFSFLRGEIDTFSAVKRRPEEISEWWLDRWYKMRYNKKVDEIARWDADTYRVDRQIDYCRQLIRGKSDEPNDESTHSTV